MTGKIKKVLQGFAVLALAAIFIALGLDPVVRFLERKFKLMETVAREQGIELAWTQVDAEGEAGAGQCKRQAVAVEMQAVAFETPALAPNRSTRAIETSALAARRSRHEHVIAVAGRCCRLWKVAIQV